jgi:hypothetical protein
VNWLRCILAGALFLLPPDLLLLRQLTFAQVRDWARANPLGQTVVLYAIGPRGFGEAAMLFLLPMQGFPVLPVASGIVRAVRGAREQ